MKAWRVRSSIRGAFPSSLLSDLWLQPFMDAYIFVHFLEISFWVVAVLQLGPILIEEFHLGRVDQLP